MELVLTECQQVPGGPLSEPSDNLRCLLGELHRPLQMKAHDPSSWEWQDWLPAQCFSEETLLFEIHSIILGSLALGIEASHLGSCSVLKGENIKSFDTLPN